MRLSDFIIGVGQPVAYYPTLARCLGSVKAAIFLCQLLYWTGKEASAEGIYKSVEEITMETGLSYREQQSARKLLTELKILSETYNRLEHRIYYRIDYDVLNQLFEKWIKENEGNGNSPTDKNAVGELTKTQLGN